MDEERKTWSSVRALVFVSSLKFFLVAIVELELPLAFLDLVEIIE